MIARDRWFRWLEWGFFPVYILITDLINASSVLIEHQRMGLPIDAWEPFVWELSSGALFLCLIPFLLWVDCRRPFQAEDWPSTLALHGLLTVPFSFIHVGGMVAIRKAVYWATGGEYSFGNVPIEVFYEYRKDLLSYVLIVAAFYAYRNVRFRYSGVGGNSSPARRGRVGSQAGC